MKSFWLRIGCFITGHNYHIIKNSTEASVKSVKKYLSAILIVSILWAFIGYSFSTRYLHAEPLMAGIVSFIMVLIVIQIERQIILQIGKNNISYFFRFMIGIVMALIGSVIIDQIIFTDDIEKGRISNTQAEVNRILPEKTIELDKQILAYDSTILSKEQERAKLITELDEKPFSRSTSTEIRRIKMQKTAPDGSSYDTLVTKREYTLTDVPNQKAQMLPQLDLQINQLRQQKAEKEEEKINIRQSLEDELEAKTGFLEELQVLIDILTSSAVSLVIWSLFFLFFLSLELFVLFNKIGDKGNDYEMTILHQVESKQRLLRKLTRLESDRDDNGWNEKYLKASN